MNDAVALRRTVRRCTAIVVVSIGLVGGALAGPGDAAIPFGIAAIASLYLLAEVIKHLPDFEEQDDNSAGSSPR